MKAEFRIESIDYIVNVAGKEIVIQQKMNAADNSFICYEYHGYDIYMQIHEYEGEICYIYIWNHSTQDELFGFNELSDVVAYIIDQEYLASMK